MTQSSQERAAEPVALVVGDTLFEGWLGCHEPDRRQGRTVVYTKQDMRDCYWAGYQEGVAASRGSGVQPPNGSTERDAERVRSVMDRRISHEAKAAAHHSGRWHAAKEWHLTRYSAMCELRDAVCASPAPATAPDGSTELVAGQRVWVPGTVEEEYLGGTTSAPRRLVSVCISKFNTVVFPREAVCASVDRSPDRVPAKDELLRIAAYFRRIGDLWEGPDGVGTPGTDLCQRIAQDAWSLAHERMALGLTEIPPLAQP